MSEFEVRKIRHDPTELIMRAVQPVIWLLVFGEVFTHIRAIPTGNLRYIDFLTPGVLAQSTLFIAIFSGIALIWERDLGIVHKSWSVRHHPAPWHWAKRCQGVCADCRKQCSYLSLP